MPKVTTTRKTHYEVLGLPTNCTVEHIKRSYRRLQLRYHPDKTNSLSPREQSEGEAISKAANAAYEVLVDEQKRQEYDKSLLPRTSPFFSPYSCSRQHSSFCDVSETESSPGPEKPINERAPPYNYIYPNTLDVNRAGWGVTIEISKRFECQCWGPNYAWADADSILFYVKVEERADYYGLYQKDVRVATSQTPGQRRVTKIESYFKHRKTETGPEINLWVKLFAPESRSRNPDEWEWAWDAKTKHCNPPSNVANYATSIFFEHADFAPCDSTKVYQQPEDQILRDRDFNPKEQIELVDLGDDTVKMVEHDRNDKMKRTIAFGYLSTEARQTRQNERKRPSRGGEFSEGGGLCRETSRSQSSHRGAEPSRKPSWGGKKMISRPRQNWGGSRWSKDVNWPGQSIYGNAERSRGPSWGGKKTTSRPGTAV